MSAELENPNLRETTNTFFFDLGRTEAFLGANLEDDGFRERFDVLMAKEAMTTTAIDIGLISPDRAARYRVGRILQAEEESGQDYLTGLKNRRGFTREGAGMLRRLQDIQQPASCLVIDIDHFKQINDDPGQGHRVGDLVLTHVAGFLTSTSGPNALVGRLGGDEMAILTELPTDDAFKLATDLNTNVTDVVAMASSHTSEFPLKSSVTLSIGVSSTEVTNGAYDLKHLLRTADVALYDAKREGRNTARVYGRLPR